MRKKLCHLQRLNVEIYACRNVKTKKKKKRRLKGERAENRSDAISLIWHFDDIQLQSGSSDSLTSQTLN